MFRHKLTAFRCVELIYGLIQVTHISVISLDVRDAKDIFQLQNVSLLLHFCICPKKPTHVT